MGWWWWSGAGHGKKVELRNRVRFKNVPERQESDPRVRWAGLVGLSDDGYPLINVAVTTLAITTGV